MASGQADEAGVGRIAAHVKTREPTRRLRAAVSSDDAADDEDDEYIGTPPLKEPNMGPLIRKNR